MDYPLSPANWLCRALGHSWRYYTGRDGVIRRSCRWDGLTEPPFRKVKQHRLAEGEDPYLPDDQQPAGAV